MADDLPPDVLALAQSFSKLSSWAQANAPQEESKVRGLLADHFGSDPQELPIVSETVATYERPNLQVALDAFLGESGRSADVIGLSVMPGYRTGLSTFAKRDNRYGMAVEPGSVEYVTVTVAEREIRCLASALLLIDDAGDRFAVFTRHDEMHGRQGLQVEVMAPTPETASGFIAELRELMNRHNVYRGRVLALGQTQFGDTSLTADPLPEVRREDIVLPPGVLERIERHTIAFGRATERLRAAGRHIKRGLLLHGPPGTGKTLCAMYLISEMPERTTLLLSGQGLRSIAASCAMARRLQPATVILEDVDLIAMDRHLAHDPNALLFQLLNEMDGLERDADVVFLLTTNRPEVLETALAQRPGRIDEAVELPLPDEAGRARLLELYSRGMDLALADRETIVKRTAGVSAAFVRELLRRGALLAALAGDEQVADKHVNQALDELEEMHSGLTRRLLGAGGGGPAPVQL
jgi:cell division protease FtsH